MTKRAKKLIEQTYGDNCEPAIAALVDFAAQNSGIDARNYFDPYDRQAGRMQQYREGLRAFRDEQRSISQDWQRFKNALAIAAAEGVTDKEVIDAAPRAFSGRLEWKPIFDAKGNRINHAADVAHWHYTTGQYFPTEYRKAAATVLEEATRQVRLNRPPQKRAITSITELKALNRENGGCWFNPGEMRFFGTRIESGIIRGKYFVTSEQPPHGPRKYSVRSFDETGDVETVGDFCAYLTKHEALAAVPKN